MTMKAGIAIMSALLACSALCDEARQIMSEAEASTLTPEERTKLDALPGGSGRRAFAKGVKERYVLCEGTAWRIGRDGSAVKLSYKDVPTKDLDLLCCVDTPYGKCCKPVRIDWNGLWVVIDPWRESMVKESRAFFIPWRMVKPDLRERYGW